jgi:hypothetical protein
MLIAIQRVLFVKQAANLLLKERKIDLFIKMKEEIKICKTIKRSG